MAVSASAFNRGEALAGLGRHLAPSLLAAAVVGFLVAGVGGRLAMLLLRITSGSGVIGLESDDGFIIGRVTGATVALVLFLTIGTTMVLGPLYAVGRLWIPRRARSLVFGMFLALVGGAALVHSDGVDFTVLSPRLLAVALFVAIPAACGALLEPLHNLVEPRTGRLPRPVLGVIAVAGCASMVAIGPPGVAAAVFGLGAVLLGYGPRIGLTLLSRPFAWVARAGMAALSGVAGADLARDLGSLF